MTEPIRVWHDPEGDYLEVMLHHRPGYFRETAVDQVMVKVDAAGQILGFSILRVSSLKERPLELSLATPESQ